MTESLETIMSQGGEAVPENPNIDAAASEGQNQPPQLEAGQQEGEQPGQKMVPHEALHAEKQKAKRYTEEVSSLRQEIADRDAAWERRIAQLMQANRPQEAQVDPVDAFLKDPESAARNAVNPQFEQMNQVLMANAQLVASVKFGDDKVQEAERAFLTAMQSRSLDPADYQRVVTSPNRYAAAVQWHQRQQAQQAFSKFGDDPEKAINAEVERRLAERAQSQQAPAGGQQAAMPQSFTQARAPGTGATPQWSGPLPLSDLMGR